MSEQLNEMFNDLKQELKDIHSANDNAISLVANAWSGEASVEYINAMRLSEERILSVISRIEKLQDKLNVFADTQSVTDTSI